MFFVDYSSAFNTIVPSRLITKMLDLGLGKCYDNGLSQQPLTECEIEFAHLLKLISHSFFKIAVDAIYSVTDAVTWFIVFHFSAMFFPATRGNRSTPPF